MALARTAEEEKTAEVEPIATRATPPAAVWTPEEQAEKLFRRLRDRGLILKVEADPERGEVIRPYLQTKDVEPIRAEEAAELVRLRPFVLAFLKWGRPTPTEGVEGPKVPPARRVSAPVQVEVRSLIGRLAGNADPEIESRFCRAMASALNDHKAESLRLFLGLAGHVRRGELAEGCLQEAFEAACGRRVENRGAMFTGMVKRWIGATRKAGRGEGRAFGDRRKLLPEAPDPRRS